MSGVEATKIQEDERGAATKPKREVSQVTLSTIGDVSLAASEVLARTEKAPTATRWLPILTFFVLLYFVSAALAIAALKAAPWVRVFLVPLLPVLCAIAAFWWRQQWKFRTKDQEFKIKIYQDALNSLGREAANATNAIRANLTGFRSSNPQVLMAEHLGEIEEGARRIDAAIQKAQNPVAWWDGKTKKTPQSTEPADIEDARSSIAL